MANAHVHPVFADILRGIEQQPLVLHRAATKASPRRFSADPLTGFGDDISTIGSDRWREVRDQEHADHLADERRERDGGTA